MPASLFVSPTRGGEGVLYESRGMVAQTVKGSLAAMPGGVSAHKRLLPLMALLAAMAPAALAPAQASPAPPIRHVWVINEENASVCANPSSSAASAASAIPTGCPAPGFPPFLGKVLPAEGTLIQNYYGVGHQSLDNYIAEVSGQAPNPDDQADCTSQLAGDLTPGTADASQQQAIGQGCTYPARVKTIADQLQAKGLTWKGYEE